MYISSLAVKNFKRFEDVRFHFDPQLNVLTGENNSGKTTALEALALWGECFLHLLWPAKRADPAQKLRVGDLRLGSSQPTYLASTEIRSVRNSGASIFHRLDTGVVIELEAVITAPEHASIALTVAFTIRSARGGLYDLYFKQHGAFNYEDFNLLFRARPEPLSVIFAAPVAALLFQEEFKGLPKIRRHVRSRESVLALRNRLYQLSKRPAAFADFTRQVSEILCGEPSCFMLEFIGNENTDVDIQVNVAVGRGEHQMRDIALLGSGALQILEILLALYSERHDLNLILLDEPDSHIYRDIQRRLLDALRGAPGCQVFLTTHNESLIRHSRPQQVFHLGPDGRGDIHPIVRDWPRGVRSGLQPSPYRKVLQALGSETALDFVNALAADKLVLVEGEDDARHIHAIADLQRITSEPFHGMYWAFGGIIPILQNVPAYRSIFSGIRNGVSLWDKSILIVDRDYLTDEMRDSLTAELTAELKIPVYIWESYTLEATLLREEGKLADLLLHVLQDRTGRRVDVATVRQQLHDQLAAHVQRWISRLSVPDDPDWSAFKIKVHNALADRRKWIEHTIKGSKALKLPDAALQPTFERYARSWLEQGRLDHLATKDEVLEILDAVGAHHGVTFSSDLDWFEKIVRAAGVPSTWPAQWAVVHRLLRA